ncbi:MAG: PorT family protein [Gemmatimonadetes bacterium]|nr:MAG: PorT family protein [Gemmatimonadota bacterium]
MRSFVRVIALFALVSLLPAPLAAQIELGFRGGINLATLNGDAVQNSDVIVGPDFGVFATYPVADWLGIQVGAAYAQRGADQTLSTGLFAGRDGTLKLSYIDVPVLARLRLWDGGLYGVRLLAGPSFSFRVGCDMKFHGRDRPISNLDCEDPGVGLTDVRDFDFGILGGLGFEYQAGRGVRLLLEGTYDFGLSDLSDSAVLADVQNRAFQVRAGLSFPIGS